MNAGFFKRVWGQNEEEVKVDEDPDRVSYMIKKEQFILDNRYKPIKKIGKGAYGMVISAIDKKDNNCKIAIKKNVKVFQSKTCAKRILREIKVLNHFNHPNIIKLRDIINPVTIQDFDNIYLVMDYMQSDLHRVIYSENRLTNNHIAYIMYQVLCGLKYMHSVDVYHRDLKPSNVLVNSACEVKICDFGLARAVPEEDEELTEYVVTRWYRAPEVVLNAKRYGAALDVWSVGCILAELYYRKPIFRGEDYADQLKKIFRIIGNPSQEDIAACVDGSHGRRFLKNLQVKAGKSWENILPDAPEDAIDLISRLLVFNPEKRFSVDEALRHPFFREFYDEDFIENQCVCSEGFCTDFENMTRSKGHIRMMMMEEIRRFRPNATCPATVVQQKPKATKSKPFSFFRKGLRQSMSSEAIC